MPTLAVAVCHDQVQSRPVRRTHNHAYYLCHADKLAQPRSTGTPLDGGWFRTVPRLNLRFRTQRAATDTGADVITAQDPKTGHRQDVWFRAATPGAADRAETDRAVRAIMTSGDGLSPETAFVVGGIIGAEYQILCFMDIESTLQGLLTIRGCSFDRLSGRDLDTGEPPTVYFTLGSPDFDYRGECVLQPSR